METSNEIYNIKRIIYWKTEVKKIKDFRDSLMFSAVDNEDKNTVIKRKTFYIFNHEHHGFNKKIEIDNSIMGRFCDFLNRDLIHLEKLIEESDPKLVKIADEYLDGNLGQLINDKKRK